MDGEKLVTVLQTPDPVELAMARNLLVDAGIPATVDEGGAASYLTAVLGSAFSGVKTLQVREQDAERALEVLEQAWGEREDAGPTADESPSS